MTLRQPFIPEHNVALFLDVDGTLVEIAPTPGAVKVPAALCNTLQLVSARVNGALALISGRSIRELDRLFAPHVFPVAGQHGAERRDAQGHFIVPTIDCSLLQPLHDTLLELQLRHRGLLLEDKGATLAMHYRLAPEYEPVITSTMSAFLAHVADKFILRPGKYVLEIAPAGFSKRTAIEAFMNEAPFIGKIPVFMGDDITDEDGFAAVNALGGYSIRVGPLANSSARYHFDSVTAVLAWLSEYNLEARSSIG